MVEMIVFKKNSFSLVGWYVIFGALHECFHVAAAFAMGLSEGIFDEGYVPFALRIIFGRHCYIPALGGGYNSLLVQHIGWVGSVISYILISSRKTEINEEICFVAMITALEAISTDLLQFGVLRGISNARKDSLHCGNFGIIILHHAWLLNRGKSALDILEKMVNVTMMRGAQSGGVVSYVPSKLDASFNGVRTRVVNRKRSDLSKEIRHKVQANMFPFTIGSNKTKNKSYVPIISGHTRFATSSKSTMEGTHPQRWTPAKIRRVYDFSLPKNVANALLPSCKVPREVNVENYITHNGDFDSYFLNGKTYDLNVIQKYLESATGFAMPSSGDSCCIAGMIDLLRTQGSFGLSARYAIVLGFPSSKMDAEQSFPNFNYFDEVGNVFERNLGEIMEIHSWDCLCDNLNGSRYMFACKVATALDYCFGDTFAPLEQCLDNEIGASLLAFCMKTIDAFYDNDLLMATRTFLTNAKGSFGLCVTSTLDAHRQMCFAARGQTMSVAFYPSKGIVCFGSELAAVKAGLSVSIPDDSHPLLTIDQSVDKDDLRLDLDDLGGEIVILDWGSHAYTNPPVSLPHRNLVKHSLMNNRMTAIILQESKSLTQYPDIYHRMVPLSRNNLIKPIPEECEDNILRDIEDIPRICQGIQSDWESRNVGTGLNRLTAFNLTRSLRKRLENHISGNVSRKSVDILLTGCEVSLWLAEQFANDLKRSFPILNIQAISSNKILGLFGQDIAVPSLGFPFAQQTQDLDDTIIIIVSHSGGTFGPLSCSNLLQSKSNDIFVVTSEWDTQIGKQLRAIGQPRDSLHSRIFSTDVGMRSAEPCSVSVAATQQLLTCLFEYISAFILSDSRFKASAHMTEEDLRILKRCNQLNIDALTSIVGVDVNGYRLDVGSETETSLRRAGDLWADHVLEVAKAYIMTIAYIALTVVTGCPLFYALSILFGMDISNSLWIYLVRILDAVVYIALPQINIIILRLFEHRNLRHRMVGRTVVIGDIPWVAQCAEAFLSKIFACSYSIAGINVLSGNPADHFVHRHTHRVARGTLIICGRPDGRLSALATLESSVILSVNQASSIQSWGGTCESITIGHNPFKLPLSERGIFLKRKRPLFICERLLVEQDKKEETADRCSKVSEAKIESVWKSIFFRFRSHTKKIVCASRKAVVDISTRSRGINLDIDTSIQLKKKKFRSPGALLCAYTDIEEHSNRNQPSHALGEIDETGKEACTIEKVISDSIKIKKMKTNASQLFEAMDRDKNGLLSEEEFLVGISKIKHGMSKIEVRKIFDLADRDGSKTLDYDEFLAMLSTTGLGYGLKLPPSTRDERGIIQVKPTTDRYFGEQVRKQNTGKSIVDVDFSLARGQHFSQELYETRIASMQRFVAMTVMFHQMGKRVSSFFHAISFGFWGYRMDRTHSIMRIATTASPVSGADVRDRMFYIKMLKKVKHSINIISTAYLSYKRLEQTRIKVLEKATLLPNTNISEH